MVVLQIEHKVLTENNSSVIYVDVILESSVGLSLDITYSGISNVFKRAITEYLNNNVKNLGNAMAIIAINGKVKWALNIISTYNGFDYINKYYGLRWVESK